MNRRRSRYVNKTRRAGLRAGEAAPQLALARFETRIGLIDHIDATLAAHQTARLVARLHSFQGIHDLHDISAKGFAREGSGDTGYDPALSTSRALLVRVIRVCVPHESDKPQAPCARTTRRALPSTRLHGKSIRAVGGARALLSIARQNAEARTGSSSGRPT